MLSSKETRHRLAIAAALLVSCLLLQATTAEDDQDQDQEDATVFPSLWACAESGAYHAIYQFRMADSNEILTAEEWADYDKRLFRLDLIGSQSGLRITYLTRGSTREMFFYKPYDCIRFDSLESLGDFGVFPRIFLGQPWDGSKEVFGGNAPAANSSRKAPAFAYGLGPLWLRAHQNAKLIQHGTKPPEYLAFPNQFHEYEVLLEASEGQTSQSEQAPFKLRFYFANSGRPEFVDMVDWIELNASGEAHTANHDDEKVLARARVIQVDYKSKVDESVFKLPLGYGCTRRDELNPSLQIDIGLVLLHQGAPNQAQFDVVVSLPHNDDDDSNNNNKQVTTGWTSERYSMRVLRVTRPRVDSSSKTESYFVTLMQFRNTGPDSPPTKTKLRRIKRVWWAPDSDQGLATVYQIDQSSGTCQVGHEEVRDQMLLQFGGFEPSSLDSSSSGGGDNDQEEEATNGPLPNGMALSLEQISVLFADYGGYHLVDEGETFGSDPITQAAKFRNRFYERRLKHFELNSAHDSSKSWSGPVSIIKQISTHSQYLDLSQGLDSGNSATGHQNLRLSNDYSTRMSLIFYNEQHDRILFKVVIELLDNREVSYGYAHSLMDVSSCFGAEDRQDLVVSYPLESWDAAGNLREKRHLIRSQLYCNLFESRWADFMTPLQVYDLQPQIDQFYLRVRMSILNIPLTQLFQLEHGLKLATKEGLSWDEARSLLLEGTSSSAEVCAQHCEHYNCFRFSHDLTTRSCSLELVGSSQDDRVRSVESSTSDLYTYFERRPPKRRLGAIRERPHVSADSLVELLSELVEKANEGPADADADQAARGDSKEGGDEENALVLRIDLKPNLEILNEKNPPAGKWAILRPSSIEHELDSMNEYRRELEESAGATEGKNGSSTLRELVRVSGGKELKLQFQIVLKDRQLQNQLMFDILDGVTYEECEQHCELNDCRAFAYCLADDQRGTSCQVTSQHSEKFLRSSSYPTPNSKGCNIYVLDYLSKFEPFGRVLPPLGAYSSALAAGPNDCASACMDHQGFKCQGFYYCKLPNIQLLQQSTTAAPPRQTRPSFMCYLVDWHANDWTESKREAQLNPQRALDNLSGDPRECSFYSRSWVAQFDKYLGRRIELEPSSEFGNRLVIKTTSNLDYCAFMCIKMNCLAFDACPSLVDSKAPVGSSMLSPGGQICQLALKSIKRSQLRRQQRCSTFVLSDKSHFNRQRGLKLIQDGKQEDLPDKEANIGRWQDDKGAKDGEGKNSDLLAGEDLASLDEYGRLSQDLIQTSDKLQSKTDAGSGHSWLARLFSLSLGVLLGFGFLIGWNEAYARGWLDRLPPLPMRQRPT